MCRSVKCTDLSTTARGIVKFNPYYDQEEFQAYKYYDQPALRLLDWCLGRLQRGRSPWQPERLRARLRRLFLARIEADLADLAIRLAVRDVPSAHGGERFELSLDLGGLIESRATLTLPSGQRPDAPLFLCLHGHQHEGRQWTVTEGPAAALARAGYACLSPDVLGLGESRGATDKVVRGSITYDLLVHDALLLGWSLNGLRLWVLERWMQAIRQSDRLGKRVGRFACAGFSLGGELALYLAALHTGIEPVYISHYACPWEASYWSKLHCKCAYVPGLMRLADLEDIYKLVAPRALAVEVGRKDRSFSWEDTEQLLGRIGAHYARVSARERFHRVVSEGDHVFDCAPQTLAFLARVSGRRAGDGQ